MIGYHQLLQLGGFFFGIGQAPVGGAMIRVVFRAVYIGIHFVLAVELELTEACPMAPGSPVETFYHTAATHGRIIFYFHFGQLAVFYQLCKSLQGIVGAPFIGSCQYDFLTFTACGFASFSPSIW